DARSLLWEFYATFATSAPLLRALTTSWGLSDPAFLRALGAAEQLAQSGTKMRDHFAAELLRGKGTGKAVDDILWQNAFKKRKAGDPGAAALYRELLARRAHPGTPKEWVEVARIDVALADPASARAAL